MYGSTSRSPPWMDQHWTQRGLFFSTLGSSNWRLRVQGSERITQTSGVFVQHRPCHSTTQSALMVAHHNAAVYFHIGKQVNGKDKGLHTQVIDTVLYCLPKTQVSKVKHLFSLLHACKKLPSSDWLKLMGRIPYLTVYWPTIGPSTAQVGHPPTVTSDQFLGLPWLYSTDFQ